MNRWDTHHSKYKKKHTTQHNNVRIKNKNNIILGFTMACYVDCAAVAWWCYVAYVWPPYYTSTYLYIVRPMHNTCKHTRTYKIAKRKEKKSSSNNNNNNSLLSGQESSYSNVSNTTPFLLQNACMKVIESQFCGGQFKYIQFLSHCQSHTHTRTPWRWWFDAFICLLFRDG